MNAERKIGIALAIGAVTGIGLALFSSGSSSANKGLAGAKSSSKVKVLDYS